MSSPSPRLDDLRIPRDSVPAPSPWGRRGLLAALAVLLGAFALWMVLRPRPLAVRTAPAREAGGTAADQTVLNASGYVTARREATVSSKVTGKVVEVLVEEGLKVAEGQILARLDDTNVRASLLLSEAQGDAARAALAETRVRLQEAEQDLQRQGRLIQNQVATQAEHDHAEAAVLALRARLAQQESEVAVAGRTLALWRQQVEDMVIRAPFAGIVTSKNAQPGEMISPMSAGGFTRTGICTLVDMDSLEIEIDVNESYINRVAPRQEAEATLDAYPDWKIPCAVIAIIPTADRQKSTVRVRVGFTVADPRILPEMSVKVAFREGATAAAAAAARPAGAPAILVPRDAVVTRDGREVVFIVRDRRAERRAVRVLRSRGDDAELAAGVTAGERVVRQPPATLGDGTPVTEGDL